MNAVTPIPPAAARIEAAALAFAHHPAAALADAITPRTAR